MNESEGGLTQLDEEIVRDFCVSKDDETRLKAFESFCKGDDE